MNYEGMYFVDMEHLVNYRHIAGIRGHHEINNIEYQQAIYISSVPMFFGSIDHISKRGKLTLEERYPVSWMHQYLVWADEYKEEWDRYGSYDDKRHPEYDAWLDRKPFDLTGSMVEMGRFMLNLWNDSNECNFMRMLSRLDNRNVEVVKCAIDIRLGLHRGKI